jgi:hypothetical protein
MRPPATRARDGDRAGRCLRGRKRSAPRLRRSTIAVTDVPNALIEAAITEANCRYLISLGPATASAASALI